MRWRQLMRALLMFKRPKPDGGSVEAMQAAARSYERAVTDRGEAADLLAVAEEVKEQVRLHNSANRYDEWLRSVIRGEV